MVKDLHYIWHQEKRAENKALKLFGFCSTAHFGASIIEIHDGTSVIFDEKKLKQLKDEYLKQMELMSKKKK